MGRIPINLRREAPQIDTGAPGVSQSFGQAGIQLAGQGQQAAIQGTQAALLGGAAIMESVDNIVSKHEAEQKTAENSSDLANGRAKTEALYQDAWEKSQKTTSQSEITQFYKAANDRADELANGKNDDGVPYFRNKESRQAYEVWLTGKKTQQRGVAISRRVNLSKQATAARFDVSEGAAIANAGKVVWTTSSDALTNVRAEQEKLVQIANARHESGQMTVDAALKHSNSTVYKLQDNFCEQALAELYASPMPPEALQGRVAEYKKAVDLVANELPADVRQKYKAGADQVLTMAAQQQKAREQAARKERDNRQADNLDKVYGTTDINGDLQISAQALKAVDLDPKIKQQLLKQKATDSAAIKQTAATADLSMALLPRIREYDANNDPGGQEKLKIMMDLGKLPPTTRTHLMDQFNDMPKRGEKVEHREAVKSFGTLLQSYLGMKDTKGKTIQPGAYEPGTFLSSVSLGLISKKTEFFSVDERHATYGQLMSDFRTYAASHTSAETAKYAQETLKPWQDKENLNKTYEAYSKPTAGSYLTAPSKAETGEVRMTHPKTGHVIYFNKKTKTYREAK